MFQNFPSATTISEDTVEKIFTFICSVQLFPLFVLWVAMVAANSSNLTNELSCHGPEPPETFIISNDRSVKYMLFSDCEKTETCESENQKKFGGHLLLEQGHG